MALEWLKIEVPLGTPGSGLAESTDPHHLPPARLVKAENLEVSQIGRFDKRRGTTARNALVDTDTILATPSQLLEVSSIDDTFMGFQHVGWIPRWNVTTSTVTMRQDLNVRSMDVAAYEDGARRLLVYVYEADDRIFAAVKDLETNTWKYHDREVVANARKPRAIRVGSYVVITYINDDDELWALHYIPILDSFSAPLAKLNDNMESPANYDIARYDDDSFVLAVAPFYDTPYVTVLSAQDFSTIQTPLAFTAESYVSAVAVAVNDAKRVAITWYESANEEVPTAVYTRALSNQWLWYSSKVALGVRQYPDELVLDHNIDRCTVVWISDTKWMNVWTFVETPEDPDSLGGDPLYGDRVVYLYHRACDTSGNLSLTRYATHVVLASKAWLEAGRAHVLAAPVRVEASLIWGTRDYNAMFLLQLPEAQEPRLHSNFAIGVGTYVERSLESTDYLGDPMWHMPSAASVVPREGIQEAVVPFVCQRLPWEFRGGPGENRRFIHWLESATLFRHVRASGKYDDAPSREWTQQLDTIGNTSYLSGALPLQYDGFQFAEHGFVMPPVLYHRKIVGSSSDPGLEAGTYTYVAVYTWKNKQGQVEYSQVSNPLKINVPGTGNKYQVHIWVRTLPLTYKSNVTISLYRTRKDLDSGYYLISDPLVFDVNEKNRTIKNSKVGEFELFVDAISDSDLAGAGNPMVYTSGGVLESDAPGPLKQVLQAKNRLWGLDANGTRILYSKPAESHEVASFSGFQSIEIQSEEPLTAIGSLDDRIVAFSRNRAWIIYGDGPTKAGVGGSFTEPQEISVPEGCVGPSAICSTAMGILYIGPSNIYMMNRGGQVQEVGNDVRETLKKNGPYWVVRHLPSRKQIRFFGTASAPVLTWNYEHNQWTTFTYTEAYEAGLVSPVVLPPARGEAPGSRIAALTASEEGSPRVVEEATDTHLDDGQWVTSTIETGHIQLDGIQGYQRVRDLSFLLSDTHSGNRYTNYQVTVSLAADDGDFYGSATLTGTQIANSRGSQGRVGVARQLCRSIRVKLEDGPDDAENPDVFGPSFLGLAMNVGLLRGTTRLRTSAKKGVS